LIFNVLFLHLKRAASANPAIQRIWAGIHSADIDHLGEYKAWWLDSGKRIESHEWAGARAIEKGETSLDEEIEIECFDGTHKIILNSALPICGNDGQIKGAVVLLTRTSPIARKLKKTSSVWRSMILSPNCQTGGYC